MRLSNRFFGPFRITRSAGDPDTVISDMLSKLVRSDSRLKLATQEDHEVGRQFLRLEGQGRSITMGRG